MPAPAHLYQDPNFWTAAVAVLALVLSQLPPVKLWFKSLKLWETGSVMNFWYLFS